MTALDETLLILDHFNSLISGRTEYCRRNIDFNFKDCVHQKSLEAKNTNATIGKEIARECADKFIILHSYTCLNIIDMFSFNDEYNKFFSIGNINDVILKNRINNVKAKNKEIKKAIDWKKIGTYRNNVLAHNLRDNKNYNRLSIDVLKDLKKELLLNLNKSIEYSEVVLKLFENINLEFENELINAKKKINYRT